MILMPNLRAAILPRNLLRLGSVAGIALLAAGCSEKSGLPFEKVSGPDPVIVEPENSLIPNINLAEWVGWPKGGAPTPAAGLKANVFAAGLEHPRWMLTLSNGDVLVAESSSPAAPPDEEEGDGSFRGFVRGLALKWALRKVGAWVTSADRITLLRDGDGDGVAEFRSVLIGGLKSPLGMAVVNDKLYIANTNSLVSVPFKPGETKIAARPAVIVPLTALVGHWTRSLVASPDGSKLYIGVGSNTNIGDKGLDKEKNRAAIWEVDVATGQHRIFASGLRNPVGMALHPDTNKLWTVVQERDELGNDLVPDYLTSVHEGGFYGWPWSYWGKHVDTRVEPARPDMVAKSIRPDYALGPHVSALGLTFSANARLGPAFQNGAFVGEHGSWGRKPFSGYKVVFVPFVKGVPAGHPVDVLDGFLAKDKAYGRPAGVQIAKDGALLVADDVGNTIWRVSAK